MGGQRAPEHGTGIGRALTFLPLNCLREICVGLVGGWGDSHCSIPPTPILPPPVPHPTPKQGRPGPVCVTVGSIDRWPPGMWSAKSAPLQHLRIQCALYRSFTCNTSWHNMHKCKQRLQGLISELHNLWSLKLYKYMKHRV